jgi:N-carbamoyl-L-amino-acid hydrolase
MWADLLPIGRNPRSGGYRRFAYEPAELAMREWFAAEAGARGLDATTDRNGNSWAWWGDPDSGPGVVTGSHLDSVPDGGAYDGPLGVISAFAAIDALRASGLSRPPRPIGVVAFADEEGARFGVACAGSRLAVGALDPGKARGLTDLDGTTMADAMRQAGHDPDELGRDDETVRRIGAFVELHVEQGRGLDDFPSALGVATSIWPHGRWRFDFRGEANHAGTTLMQDRRDPMITYAMTALAANKQARLRGARATFGRVAVTPNGTNAIPSQVTAWLDARATQTDRLDALVEAIHVSAAQRADRDGTTLEFTAESVSPLVMFDPDLRQRISVMVGVGGGLTGNAPALPTGAGHDAGILAAAGIPAAMIFVRNPTGVSHSPAERAERSDCLAGVHALAQVLDQLSRR